MILGTRLSTLDAEAVTYCDENAMIVDAIPR